MDSTWVNQRDSINKICTVGEGAVGPKLKSRRVSALVSRTQGERMDPGQVPYLRSGQKTDQMWAIMIMNYEHYRGWFERQFSTKYRKGVINNHG